jgi:hypothetical protein
MFECFLLLGKGSTWPALVVIPAVLAGSVAAICLMLLGIKGIITEAIRPKRRAGRAPSPGRVVQWIAPSRQTGQAAVKL